MNNGIKQTLAWTHRTCSFLGQALNIIEVSLIVGSVTAMAGLLIANVIARTFFTSIYFAEELSELLVILITFAGVSYSVRKAMHIRMGAFLDAMPPKWEKACIIFISVVSAVVMGIMAWFAWDYLLNAYTRGHTTPALRIPKWTFYVILPFGFGLGAIQYVRTVIKNLKEDEPWQSAEQQSEYEEEHPGAALL
ncbi:MAG: TRAP transporter small permease [Kiritimatiellia bacterium]